MRNFIVILNLAIVLLVASFMSDPGRPRLSTSADERESMIDQKGSMVPLKKAKSSASAIPERSVAAKRVSMEERRREAFVKDFLYYISEARIMHREEGKLAEQRGTSRALKDYATMMVKDQTNMLKELKQIASSKNVEVATVLGKMKTEALSDLHQLHGENFDSKFVKMMIIDYRRDIKKLQKAAQSKDADIQVFATKYLPVIKAHLAKIQSISAHNQAR